MKIKEINSSDKFHEDWDYRGYYALETEGKKLSFLDGEPEDNSLGRNFNGVYSILDLVKLAYEAGKNGEELEIESVEIDDLD
jgi:hypothetical protein